MSAVTVTPCGVCGKRDRLISKKKKKKFGGVGCASSPTERGERCEDEPKRGGWR